LAGHTLSDYTRNEENRQKLETEKSRKSAHIEIIGLTTWKE
jgi:hypothetical protein